MKKYEKPEITVITLLKNDVITTSGTPANIILVNGEYKTATTQGSMDFGNIG